VYLQCVPQCSHSRLHAGTLGICPLGHAYATRDASCVDAPSLPVLHAASCPRTSQATTGISRFHGHPILSRVRGRRSKSYFSSPPVRA